MHIVNQTEIPFHKGRLIVILSDQVDEVRKLIPVWSDEYIFASAVKGSFEGFKAYFVVLNFNFNHGLDKITPGVIAHEAFHVCNYIFLDAGIKPDVRNDEPGAALTGWIVDKIYETIPKKIKKGLM